MSTDWRALCAELVEQLERYQSDFPPKTDKMAHRAMAADAVLARACAALTAEADGPAVPEGREPASVVSEPSDEELDVLADEWLDWNLEGHRAFARAAIAADRARYRHQPAPPAAEGEVGELVEGLKLISDGMDAMGHESDSWFVARAADLLEQRHPTPVPVAERLPGPEDCTAQGWCWVLYQGFATWALEPPLGQDGKHTGYTHWLPAIALPLPAGEVK